MVSKQKKLLKKQAKQAKKAATRPKKKPITKPKRKKRWYLVLAPPEFNQVVVGETLAVDPETLVGKVVKINLMTVTRNMKKQNIMIKLKITQVKGDKAETELAVYEMNTAYVKRLAKRSKEKVDDSFVTKTKDDIRFRIKPVLFSRSHTYNSVLSNLRKTAKQFVEAYAKTKTYSQIVSAIYTNDLQREMKKVLKKVYPVSIVEIRALKRL